MSRFVGNIPGDGRDDPGYRPRANPQIPYIPELNLAVGTKIRVLKDNDRRGLVGLVGKVVQTFPGFVVVELENDPAMMHRVYQPGGFEPPRRQPRRHFRVTEVERIV